tara:strand:+ start:1715 stop:3340 length:1626 start_codon:yes stop_codon:yes gene_type:complete
MSYRNPQIIVDRSAEIYAKMATAGSDAFNQYMKYRSVAAENARKQDERIISVLNKAEESAQSRIDKGIKESKIKDPSLIEQTQELLGTYLDEGNIGFLKGMPSVLDMQVAVEIGSVKGKTRKEYKKAIQQYKALENRIIDTAGAYQVQLEEGENINSSTIEEGYTIAGVGSQKFINLASYLTLKNQEADGVSITRKTEDDGSITISGTIDTKGEGYKRYEEAGLIDPTDGELTYNDENNTASFTWKSLSSNPARELVLKRLKGFDSQEASINAGLENKKGDLSKRLYTGERSSRVEKFPNDPSREQDVTKLYIDPSVIENNVAFRGDAQAFAEQVRASPAHQRDDYILRTHGKEILEEFKNADFAKQDDIIYRELMLRNLERLTGVGEGSGLIKKEGDKYYIEEYGTPRNVTEDGLTATERREAKDLKDAKTRLDIVDTLLEGEDALPVLPAVFPTDWFNSSEGEKAKESIIDIVERSFGNIVGDIIDDGPRGFKIKVKYKGQEPVTLSTNDFKSKNILRSRLKGAIGVGVENIYDDINID